MPYPHLRIEPDFAAWASMHYWKIEEAAALLADWEPGNVGNMGQHDDIKLERITKALDRAIEAGSLPGTPQRLVPLHVVRWAAVQPFEQNDLLWAVLNNESLTAADAEDTEIRALQKENARLRIEMSAARQLPSPEQPPPAPLMLTGPESDPLGEKERVTFLKMILGMAIRKYQYKVGGRGSTSELIKRDLENAGISLTDDTIRSKLSEAAGKIDIAPV